MRSTVSMFCSVMNPNPRDLSMNVLKTNDFTSIFVGHDNAISDDSINFEKLAQFIYLINMSNII